DVCDPGREIDPRPSRLAVRSRTAPAVTPCDPPAGDARTPQQDIPRRGLPKPLASWPTHISLARNVGLFLHRPLRFFGRFGETPEASNEMGRGPEGRPTTIRRYLIMRGETRGLGEESDLDSRAAPGPLADQGDAAGGGRPTCHRRTPSSPRVTGLTDPRC